MSKFLNIRVDQIVESRWQPREGAGDPEAFDRLVANVKIHGVTDPLKAFMNEEEAYELVTGHRRRRAAIKAGLTHVPVIVVGTPKDAAGLRALREEVLFDNLLHEPLSPLEEARAFKALQEDEGYSIREMADRLGKSKSYVSERLSLLDKSSDVQDLVSARADTLRHAREIAKVEDPEQRTELIEEAKAGASYQDIKAKVDQVIPVKAHTGRSPFTPQAQEEEPEPIEERLIPVNGNGTTVYISVPESDPEPTVDEVTEAAPQPIQYKHTNPAIGAPTAAGQHCPHCGDGRGRERCNACGRDRWIIAFDNVEDYSRALTLIGWLTQK